MHENGISMHLNEDLDPGMIFLAPDFLWVFWLYTISCMDLSPMTILGKTFIFMHENFIFMQEIFRTVKTGYDLP